MGFGREGSCIFVCSIRIHGFAFRDAWFFCLILNHFGTFCIKNNYPLIAFCDQLRVAAGAAERWLLQCVLGQQFELRYAVCVVFDVLSMFTYVNCRFDRTSVKDLLCG